jgi:hypothetical protein
VNGDEYVGEWKDDKKHGNKIIKIKTSKYYINPLQDSASTAGLAMEVYTKDPGLRAAEAVRAYCGLI